MRPIMNDVAVKVMQLNGDSDASIANQIYIMKVETKIDLLEFFGTLNNF